jgi:hypothetical protein
MKLTRRLPALFLLLILFIQTTIQAQDPEPIGCLQAHYSLDFGSGNDVTGNGYHASLLNNVTITENQFGTPSKGLLFNGADSYIELNDLEPIIIAPYFSITAWVRMDGPGGGVIGSNQIFVQRANSTMTTSSIGLKSENPSGQVELAVRTDGSTVELITSPSPSYGSWHFYAGVCDGDSLYLYVDGVKVSSVLFTQTGGDVVSTDYTGLGVQFFSGDYQSLFNGAMGDVKIYECPISADQVFDQFSNVTGLADLDLDVKGIQLYPNPVASQLKLESAQDLGDLSVEIYDLKGQLYFQGSYSALQLQDLNLLLSSDQMHLLLLRNSNGDLLGSKKFMKE